MLTASVLETVATWNLCLYLHGIITAIYQQINDWKTLFYLTSPIHISLPSSCVTAGSAALAAFQFSVSWCPLVLLYLLSWYWVLTRHIYRNCWKLCPYDVRHASHPTSSPFQALTW
jgi:hypothetical protein